MKIHKGDNVIVLSGKDKGKRGEVLRALPKTGQVSDRGRPPGEAQPADDPDTQAGRDHRQGPAGARLDRGVGMPQGAHARRVAYKVSEDGTQAQGLCPLR